MQRTTRRQLIRAGAAAFAAPVIIPASALGKDGHVSPSDRITLGQIGFNWIGGSHLNRFIRNTQVQYVAGTEVHRDRLKAAAKKIGDEYGKRFGKGKYKGLGEYGDFREMLLRDDIDAVVVATPDHWHAIMSIEAAKHGKDVYCEKPASLTINEGREMVNAVRRYARVFQTGSQQRSEFGGRFRSAVELVWNGMIGDIKYVECRLGGPPRPCDLPAEEKPDEIDWDMWLGQAPWRPYHSKLADKSWRPYEEYCGGSLADMGAHHLDIINWGLGKQHSGPVEIHYPTEKTSMTFIYDNGIPLYFRGNSSIHFVGSEGEVWVDRRTLRTKPANLARHKFGANDRRVMRSNNHHQNWLESIRTRRRPIADVEIGHRTASLCHLGNICHKLKRDLKWDPDKEEFTGDDEANRMRSRPKRGVWRV
ncbi:MAG: Gfo/Idh/MocA family oxidoreductase [Planctomycetota bacterium]|jgi:predicted dehydrogenase|nr:Gfo/Idh/MocA family oxidoreductase [Planctomycetota bacterium]MDP7249858.1 Gfo/Idh/MocA family oxidoreductase [Planctomycetota bacterium]